MRPPVPSGLCPQLTHTCRIQPTLGPIAVSFPPELRFFGLLMIVNRCKLCHNLRSFHHPETGCCGGTEGKSEEEERHGARKDLLDEEG